MNNLLSKTDRKQQTINYGYASNRVSFSNLQSPISIFQSQITSRASFSNLQSQIIDQVSFSNFQSQITDYTYDPLNRLTSKTYPDQTAVSYTYDPVSRLTQVTDPTGTYSFTYDNLGRLLGTGTQYSFLSGTLANTYAYDAASNRASFSNFQSQIIDQASFSNFQSQIIDQVSFSNLQSQIIDRVSFSNFQSQIIDRVSFSNFQSQITNYTYDSLNRLTELANTVTGNFGFGYDDLGRRTSLTRPNGVDTSYSYDNLSRLLSVLHGNPGQTPQFLFKSSILKNRN